jgi:hypothetical protein
LRQTSLAKASTSTLTVLCWPSTSTGVFSDIQSLRRSRLARMNSTASSTLRSALVASRSIASTSANSTGRCER